MSIFFILHTFQEAQLDPWLAFTCSKSTTETPEQIVKSVQN